MSTRILCRTVGILCLLPAFGFGSSSVLSFVPGCGLLPPKVTSVYTGIGEPIARPRDARVEVFLAGNLPNRLYVELGQLEVLTRSRNTSLDNMLEYAKREARKLGGEAIVDVWPRAVQSNGRPVDPRGRRILTAKIVKWEAADAHT
jgi:hypothetical protein